MAELDQVDVIMGVRNEAKHLDVTLDAIAGQEGGRLGWVYVAVAPSTDDTEAILEDAKSGALSDRLEILPNPAAWVASGLNLSLARSGTALVARVDGHCSLPPDFLSTLSRLLDDDPEIAFAGPKMTAFRGEGAKAAGIALAMESPYGVGARNFRLQQESGEAETVQLGVYRRSALDAVGHFNEDLLRNQDDELHARIRQAGYKIWQELSVEGTYFPRTTYSALFRQYFGYGWWKVYAARHASTGLRPKNFAPFVLLVGAAVSTGLLARTRVPATTLVAFYTPVLVLQSLRGAREAGSMRAGIASSAAAATMHAGYGAGFAMSLCRYRPKGFRR